MERGCEEKFPLEACEAHLKVCVFETVRCGNKPCKEMLFRKDMVDHELNNCPHRCIKCQTCDLKVSSVQTKKHNCIIALKKTLQAKDATIQKKRNKIKKLQEEIKNLKEAAEQDSTSEASSLESISPADIMINLPSPSSNSSFDSASYFSDSFDEDSSFGLSTSDILEGLERSYNHLSEEFSHHDFANDDSIEYPRASSPSTHDNSNVVTDALDSTYNDRPQIRRPAKRRHPARALDSSEDENSRDIEPAPIPSPKRTLWYQNPRVIGQSSHEATEMPAQQNFSEGPLPTELMCLPSSSGASASSGNTQNGDAPFRLRPRLTKSGIKQTLSTTSVAAPRNGSAVFERTIALLEQYNLESDPEWLPPPESLHHENEEYNSDNSLHHPDYAPEHITSSDESSLSDDSSDTSYEDARSRTNRMHSVYSSSSSDDPDWLPESSFINRNN
ncbi:e3 ubiquitin-protein ligase PDZRN3 [Nephila pilipes]|uniref:E3 ubiquitin-protein ligase PDZRN3 n=1 Tax=Nephila pilipes TaxID=299642 RepID=A0A8X6T0Y0_NEPPI|nr:e3 ubiquitin-protein ligase PDZRN3 [Nephila pilipes]